MKLQQLFENSVGGVKIPVYRGLGLKDGQAGAKIVQFTVRQDRQPQDMNIALSAAFNLGIQRKFGIANIRNAEFSSTDEEAAAGYADNYDNGAIAELVVPASASIVFNTRLADSLFLDQYEDKLAEIIHRAAEESGTEDVDQFFEDSGADDLQLYMSTDGLNFFKHIFDVAFPQDAKRKQLYMERVTKFSDALVKNYQQMSPQEFASKYSKGRSAFEVIIANVTSYSGLIGDDEDDA